MQSDSNCFIQHYKSLARISMTIVCVKPPAHVKNSFIKQQQSDTAYHAKENLLCIRSPHPDPDSGSGLEIRIISKMYRGLPGPRIHM